MCSSSSNWSPISPYTYHLHPHFSPYNSSYGCHPDSQPFGSFGPFPPNNAPVVSPTPNRTLGLFHPFHHVHNKKPVCRAYVVKLLNNRIKKCHGCGAAFSRKVDGSTLEPPNNLVICHEEQRPFSDVQNVTCMSRPQNVYYHPNVSCIRHQNPSFVASEIQVPADHELQPLHERYLEDHFWWRSTIF